MRRALALAALTTSFLGLAALPAAADSDRMSLHCADGRVLERTNGSSWWDVDDGAVHTTRSVRITDQDGQVVHEQSYGSKGNGTRSTCVAQHFEWTWTVELVRAR